MHTVHTGAHFGYKCAQVNPPMDATFTVASRNLDNLLLEAGFKFAMASELKLCQSTGHQSLLTRHAVTSAGAPLGPGH